MSGRDGSMGRGSFVARHDLWSEDQRQAAVGVLRQVSSTTGSMKTVMAPRNMPKPRASREPVSHPTTMKPMHPSSGSAKEAWFHQWDSLRCTETTSACEAMKAASPCRRSPKANPCVCSGSIR